MMEKNNETYLLVENYKMSKHVATKDYFMLLVSNSPNAAYTRSHNFVIYVYYEWMLDV